MNKPANLIVRDDGVAGSNPATPTSSRTDTCTDTPDIEPAMVRCISIGWEEYEGGPLVFRAVVVFDKPPDWPLNVAWGSVPIRMQPLPPAVKADSLNT